MITKIYIDGFKSFNNFEMQFSPMTVVAGANASGKSNLFDALRLLASLAEEDNLKKAFKAQRGEFTELFTQFAGGEYARQMTFMVEMLVNAQVKDAWGNTAKLKYTRLRYELQIRRYTNNLGMEDLEVVKEDLRNLKSDEDKWIKLIPKAYRDTWRPPVKTGRRGTPYMETILENEVLTVLVPQDGTQGNKRRFPLKQASRTVLSSFDTIDFPHVLAAKEEMRAWRFLQLNPEVLRRPTDKNSGEDRISTNGDNLAGALFRIKNEELGFDILNQIANKLQTFLPSFVELRIEDDKERNQYLISLLDREGKVYSSRVLSEGSLRILALCIIEFDKQFSGLLCFEEPENGIHPSLIPSMYQLLHDLSSDFEDENSPLRQVIVNTHSPVLVKVLSEKSREDNLVGLWFSKVIDRVSDVEKQRRKLSVTEVIPVQKDGQGVLDFPEKATKLSTVMVEQYLETMKPEKQAHL